MNNFKCFHCFKKIGHHEDIQFACDHAFCTFDCRDNHLKDKVETHTSHKPHTSHKSKCFSNSFTQLLFQPFKGYTTLFC